MNDCALVTVPCLITIAAGVFAPGHLGELTRYLPFELFDDVLESIRTGQRRMRALPSRAGMERADVATSPGSAVNPPLAEAVAPRVQQLLAHGPGGEDGPGTGASAWRAGQRGSGRGAVAARIALGLAGRRAGGLG